MISDEYFQDNQQSLEKFSKLKLLSNLPEVFLSQYFDDLVQQLDLNAEKLIALKNLDQIEDIEEINRARQLMLNRISFISSKLTEQSQNLKIDITNFRQIDDKILHSKKLIFQNNWIFFYPNRNPKSKQNDFGRLVIVKYTLNEDLALHFNKIANLNNNSSSLKRFILSKIGNSLCSNSLKLYSISNCISENLKDSKKYIIEIKQEDIFNIEEITFERYELVAIEQLNGEEKWPRLHSIDLNHNKIKHVTINSFLNFNCLKNLNLSFNKLEKIESNWFRSLVNLEQLNISNNRVSSLESDSFAGLENLKVLDLSGNSLSQTPLETFLGLSNLVELNMSCNNFHQISNDMFSGLNSLQILYLNSNEINFVQQNAFKTLYSLKEIHLNMNKLAHIEEAIFSDQINSLVKIDLRFNEIKSLSPKIFEKMNFLKIVLLYGNIDLIHELNPRDFSRISGTNEEVNYLTFDGNYYESEEEIDEEEDEDDDDNDDEMDFNSDASDSDDEKYNYDGDF